MTEQIRLKEYLIMIGSRIEEAEDRSDKEECHRLGMLLISVAREFVAKVDVALRTGSSE